MQQARLAIHHHRSQAAFATQGTRFWIVRPEISVESISGLSTVVSGPYIEASPGNGPPATDFLGLDKPPAAQGDGLHVVLHAVRVGNLQTNSPLYFRGIQVGLIGD